MIWKHAFKNAALPVVTFAALVFVALLNGSIIIETVFGWPGLGLLVIEAVDSRDYPDRAGRRAVPVRDVHRRQPAGRRPLRLPQPEDPVRVMTYPRSATADAVAPPRRDRRWPPLLPLAIVIVLVVCALLAPWLAPRSPRGGLARRAAGGRPFGHGGLPSPGTRSAPTATAATR